MYRSAGASCSSFAVCHIAQTLDLCELVPRYADSLPIEFVAESQLVQGLHRLDWGDPPPGRSIVTAHVRHTCTSLRPALMHIGDG